MSRFLLAAQKRPELEIDDFTGEYTFSVVPRYSFFADENHAVPTTNQESAQRVEVMVGQDNNMVVNTSENSVTDKMTIANKINKECSMATCKLSDKSTIN